MMTELIQWDNLFEVMGVAQNQDIFLYLNQKRKEIIQNFFHEKLFCFGITL